MYNWNTGRRKNRTEEIIAKNFTNIMTVIKKQIQDAQKRLGRKNTYFAYYIQPAEHQRQRKHLERTQRKEHLA